MRFNIRKYHFEDNNELYHLFYNTVHNINIKDYNIEQIKAWAPNDISIDKWCSRFETDYTLIAQINKIIVGFANIDCFGYLDCLYVHKDYQRLRIGSVLLKKIENHTKKNGLFEIRVDASITSKCFFLRHGYELITENIVERNNIELINYKMIKKI